MFTILLFSLKAQIAGALSGVSGAIQAYPLIKCSHIRFIFMVGAQINDSKGRAYLSLGFPLPISSWVYNSTFHPRQVGNTGQKRAEGPKSSAHTQHITPTSAVQLCLAAHSDKK